MLFDSVDLGLSHSSDVEEEILMMREFGLNGSLNQLTAPDEQEEHFSHFQDRPWAEDDDKLLMSLVREHGYGCWEEICSKLHRCDAKDCENRYWSRRSQIRGLNFWTEEEDALLRSLMEKYEGSKPNWRLISSYLPTRTTAAIKTHWRDIRKKERERNITEESTPDSDKASNVLPTSPISGVLHRIIPSTRLDTLSSDSLRCNSEDSQVTYVPDADPKFCQWSASALDEDTCSSYPTSKQWVEHSVEREGSMESNFDVALPFPMFNIEEGPSREASDSNGSLNHEMSFSESHFSSKESMSHCAEEDDAFVSSFIESFGDFETELTTCGPAFESTCQVGSDGAPTFDQPKHTPKRVLTSWEKAKKSFPPRKRCGTTYPNEDACEGTKSATDSPSQKKRKLGPSSDKVVSAQKRYTKARERQEARDTSVRYKSNYTIYGEEDDVSHRSAIANSLPVSSVAYFPAVNGGMMRVSQTQEHDLVGGVIVSSDLKTTRSPFELQNMLVYVPCIYTNNPHAESQPVQYTFDHSSLMGWRQPSSGTRFIHAPVVVPGQIRTSMAEDRANH